MIAEFLHHLLTTAEGKLFSADDGVYVVAESEDCARFKLISAMYDELCLQGPGTYPKIAGISSSTMPEFLQDVMHMVS